MKTETQRSLIEKILGLHKLKISDVAPHSSTVPVSNYTSEKRYRAEVSDLFKETVPLIIGRSVDIPHEGDFFTWMETEVPVLVVRGKDQKIRAFINVCRHRGTLLVSEANGKGKKFFTCPYHSWTYNINGDLIAIPHEYGFDDQDGTCLGLNEISVQELFGFIWCIPGGKQALDIAGFLTPAICQDMESYAINNDVVYDVRVFERDMNWKLTVDTFLENYHVKHAHRTTIDHYFLDNIGLFDSFGPHVRVVFPKKSILELDNTDQNDWPDIRQHANELYAIFPNTLILMEPDHVSISHVYPKTIERTKVVSYTLLQKWPETEKAKAYWAKNNDILYTALEEDFGMARLVQLGLHSGANQNLIHGKYEKGLRYFHQAIEAALQTKTAEPAQ